jgi:hypothetical protein
LTPLSFAKSSIPLKMDRKELIYPNFDRAVPCKLKKSGSKVVCHSIIKLNALVLNVYLTDLLRRGTHGDLESILMFQNYLITGKLGKFCVSLV